MPGDPRFFHKGSFLAELTKTSFFLLEVRESELTNTIYSYHADFIAIPPFGLNDPSAED